MPEFNVDHKLILAGVTSAVIFKTLSKIYDMISHQQAIQEPQSTPPVESAPTARPKQVVINADLLNELIVLAIVNARTPTAHDNIAGAASEEARPTPLCPRPRNFSEGSPMSPISLTRSTSERSIVSNDASEPSGTLPFAPSLPTPPHSSIRTPNARTPSSILMQEMERHPLFRIMKDRESPELKSQHQQQLQSRP